MLLTNSNLLNSCRVCRSPNQDGDHVCLYKSFSKTEDTKPELSEAGTLYENLLNISLNMWDCYPQFLCNSCDLQMKLFKKLKDKAYKTLGYLQQLYREESPDCKSIKANEPTDTMQEEELNELFQEREIHSTEPSEEHLLEESHLNNTEGEQESESQCDEREDYTQSLTSVVEEIGNQYNEENYVSSGENTVEICAIVKEEEFEQVSELMTEEQTTHQEPTTASSQYSEETSETETLIAEFKIPVEGNTNTLTEDKLAKITLELDTNSVIDNNDYVTEIYVTENETCNENTENIEEYDAYEETNNETNLVFNDVEYVLEETSEDVLIEQEDEVVEDDELKVLNAPKRRKTNNSNRIRTTKENTTNTKKKEYKCGPCQLDLKTRQAFRNHRIEVHAEKYPCSVCSKELKSLAALHTHMKLHSDRKDFQCEICAKSFNQKAHYQYHMNRHNNVRNFKCTICEKGFLSKADLNVHMRFHTGQRPYVCDICGKDYLMMEHLKAHAIIHSQEYFQCDICQHKFATHKTLRTHIKTIHEDEPRFKCNFCEKAFRRKHHLEYHLRLHRKNVKVLDNTYELIDDPDDPTEVASCNTDDLIDQELIDDPGFIAL
ncbi:hypothetical protein DOY81_006507 [Sarcophaga bullata]|nr:hypothetical protein DOY81_006507 [Sarcophaga bullata]